MASGISGKHRATNSDFQPPDQPFSAYGIGRGLAHNPAFPFAENPTLPCFRTGVTADWATAQSFTRHASTMPRRQRFQRWWKHPKSITRQIMPKKHAIERDAPWPHQEKP
jgi:hypothetical protein